MLINVNIGILGHVDSGKTSLVKALSTILSTASLDKNPQSQQRGITLDLGFSSFTIPLPEHLRSQVPPNEQENENNILFTLVDCPGHSSLIRTIIGGAQIIDMMILVIDINKGIQTQTAECLVIGEITTDSLIVVLNKVDMIPIDEREERIEKMKRKLKKVFSTTRFSNPKFVITSAAVGGEKVASIGAMVANNKSNYSLESLGIDSLISTIVNMMSIPTRRTDEPFLYAIDHCFPIKGHGTVLTGTVLRGSVAVNNVIELPELQQQRKVKSLQMFHKSVQSAKQGDRLAICITNLDPKLIERGVACQPSSLPLLTNIVCLVKKVRFFKQVCKSNSKYHISIGHSTILANVTFFGSKELSNLTGITIHNKFKDLEISDMIDNNNDDLIPDSVSSNNNINDKVGENTFQTIDYPVDSDFEYQDELQGTDGYIYGKEPIQWAYIQLQQPIYYPYNSLIIGSRLDIDSKEGSIGSSQCRLAFYGPIKKSVDNIKLYHSKSKQCQVFKLFDHNGVYSKEIIGYKLVQDGGDVSAYIGMFLETSTGHVGKVTSSFGSDGKFKVKFYQKLGVCVTVGSILTLRFKRYLNDKTKSMSQFGLYTDFDIYGDQLQYDNLIVNSSFNNDLNINSEAKIEEIHANNLVANSINLHKLIITANEADINHTISTGEINIPISNSQSVDKVLAPALTKPYNNSNIRIGTIESFKLVNNDESISEIQAIVTGAFKMEENIRIYTNALVKYGKNTGKLLGPFAKMGKCKVSFPNETNVIIGDKVDILII